MTNELRLGNYIFYNTYDIIKKEDYKSIIQVDECNWSKISCSPDRFDFIPLNEELLLRLGFKKEKDRFITLFTKNKIMLNPYKNCFAFIDYTEIKYIHHLQNLYYALTGEELSLSGI